MTQPSNNPIDIGPLLETTESSPYLKWLVALTALAVVFDGADIQLLAVAIPSLMKDWQLQRADFAPIVTAGLIGMMAGGALAGMIGDRLGRKSALLLSVIVFAVSTLGMATAQGLASLGAFRFVAGIGLGGAIPNAAAMVTEFVPRRQRTAAVVLTIVCVPIGGMAAGFLAGKILPVFGWRWLFVLGGLTPLVCLVAQFFLLSESPRFLARHPRRWPELATFLRRAGHGCATDSAFVDSSEKPAAKTSVAALFTPDFLRDTVALWIGFAACMLAVYAGFNWIPALLSGAGWAVADASRGILYFNLGGVVGAVVSSLVIARVGSKPVMLGLAVAAVASALMLARLKISAQAPMFPVLAMLTLTGGVINALMVATYALAAHVYPTVVRATGVGAAVSFGRIGAVLSASVGSWMLDLGGYPYFFTMVAGAMMICFMGLATVRRQIQKTESPIVSPVTTQSHST